MRNKFEWIKKNQVFVLISIVVVLIAYISLNLKYIGKNPFAQEEYLNNPVQVYVGEEKRYYITEASSEIFITDSNNKLLDTIEADYETSFSTATEVVATKDGTVYVLDKLYNDDGSSTYSERILKFSKEGKMQEVAYEVETIDEAGEQNSFLNDLCIYDDKIYVSKIMQDGVHVYAISQSGAEECVFMPMEDAFDMISDTAFSRNMEVAVAMKNGDVRYFQNGEVQEIYLAREHDTKEYISMIAELTYGDDDILYLCDVGQREIYSLDEEKKALEVVVARNRFSVSKSEKFSEAPIYTGLSVNNGVLSMLSAEYYYDVEADEKIYLYNMLMVTKEGENIMFSETINISKGVQVSIAFVYLALVILIGIFIYAMINIVKLLKQMEMEEGTKLQLAMIVTALTITVGVCYVMSENYNEKIVKEAGVKLSNVAYLIGQNVDKDYLASIQSPDDFYAEEYQVLDQDVREILHNKVNHDSHMYAVIYKVTNDVVYEAYRDDMLHGVVYPMAGGFIGSTEERIAKANEAEVTYEMALSEGTYIYSLVPVYDNDGDVLAFIETGMDYGTFDSENKNVFTKVLMLAVMAVIIVMLLFTELLHGKKAFAAKKVSKRENSIGQPDLIRPISFLFVLVANMSTAFLPIYGMKLWNENFPVQQEVAAAFPITAELTVAAVVAFLCGFLIKKIGVKLICILGAFFYVAGNVLSALAPNLGILIIANSICGTGSGFLTIALNTWAASYKEEAQRNKGFIHINASYLAGLNCGTVIGSLVWENFGIQAVYYVAAVGAVVIALLSMLLIGKVEVAQEDEEEEGEGKLKELFTPAVVRFFICITVPYLICTAFLEYFFPIQAELSGLSATHISMAFLLSGLISIYIGSSLAEPITEKMGVKKAMVLASFIYAAALLYLVINPTVWSCYVVVVLFAVADSFGLSAQSVYYSSLDEVEKVGQSKALGVNSTVESITAASGSLVFGAALMLGTQKGIFVIAVMFSALLFVFMVTDRKHKKM